MYDLLKQFHITCALLSISGFALRGYWLLRRDPRLTHPLTRVLPHMVDTVLLVSAVAMLSILRVSPLALDWLTAKLAALLVYIALGMVALRFGRSRRVRIGAFWLALATGLYIISVAYTRSPMGALSQAPDPDYGVRMTSSLSSVMSSMANLTPSRPSPLSLTPP